MRKSTEDALRYVLLSELKRIDSKLALDEARTIWRKDVPLEDRCSPEQKRVAGLIELLSQEGTE